MEEGSRVADDCSPKRAASLRFLKANRWFDERLGHGRFLFAAGVRFEFVWPSD